MPTSTNTEPVAVVYYCPETGHWQVRIGMQRPPKGYGPAWILRLDGAQLPTHPGAPPLFEEIVDEAMGTLQMHADMLRRRCPEQVSPVEQLLDGCARIERRARVRAGLEEVEAVS